MIYQGFQTLKTTNLGCTFFDQHVIWAPMGANGLLGKLWWLQARWQGLLAKSLKTLVKSSVFVGFLVVFGQKTMVINHG